MQYTWLNMPEHNYLIVVDQGKLALVGSPDAKLSEATRYIKGPLVFDREEMLPFRNAIYDYLSGDSREIAVPLVFHGTKLQVAVWRYLMTIPYGETRTYKQVAVAVDRPRAFQAIGNAVGRNPLMMAIPCHRVLRTDGGLGGFRGGLTLKRKLLALEQGQHPTF